ncbi:hypothetical protein FA13DRAFT_1759730 [Coprinellus micaceus]|uniref:Uncharacterized protein n=1 Tax=Coprinellus micaceus TaxID=71717 RepID=A0A4Y7RQI6_COPMI|nr:hypothetical protein FA13DRAFT_1759730 [Coprinellus micaceus]
MTCTGCFYSLPPIRHRPIYPSIPGDSKKTRLFAWRAGAYGGIMVAWCMHSVCYGFHHMPTSEGRNDVFSAMVTRWPIAPEQVVYDFACALGPYCMLREPEFFKNTLFAIDDFHAKDHTKSICCQDRAIIFTKVFLSVWNRRRILNLG